MKNIIDKINKNNELSKISERSQKKENTRENIVKIDVYDEQYKSLKTEEKLEDENNLENNVEWKEYHEKLFVDWADKALCYRWLHLKSSSKYIRLRNLYTIPVIILSTLTGTANFALERVPEEYQGHCQIAIGSFNILAGIITTISQFLKINELCEAHRVAGISWDKFYRNIRVELVKSPENRINVIYFMKYCKDEYDRLIETSPNIDTNIIKEFNKTFKIKTNINDQKSKEALKSFNKPEILDSLESTKDIVYKVNNKSNDNLMKIIKSKKMKLEKEDMIDNFIRTFEKEFSRKPSIIEIYDNLDNKISHEDINEFLNSNKL
jgi:hypothetical protein